MPDQVTPYTIDEMVISGLLLTGLARRIKRHSKEPGTGKELARNLVVLELLPRMACWNYDGRERRLKISRNVNRRVNGVSRERIEQHVLNAESLLLKPADAPGAARRTMPSRWQDAVEPMDRHPDGGPVVFEGNASCLKMLPPGKGILQATHCAADQVKTHHVSKVKARRKQSLDNHLFRTVPDALRAHVHCLSAHCTSKDHEQPIELPQL